MVMAQSLLRLLKARDPERALDVLAPAWSLPIVSRMPEVRRGIASETAHGEIGFAKRRRIAAGLRGDYDTAIVMPRSFKAALIPWFARIPRRIGFRGESRFFLINEVRPFDPIVLDQTVKRFVALGLDAGEELPGAVPLPSLKVNDENRERALRALGLSVDRPVVAMMPGAEYGPAKCWPLEYFAALARRLDDAGYAVWILGSDKDRPAGDAIAAAATAVNLCGRTSLEDVIDLLSACERAVSNDSGLMHIAAAVGTHVHGIYGSSSPKFTPPLTKSRDIHEIHLDCRPCFERECPLGHTKCLRDLYPDAIYDKIAEK
ncbi:MAG: lipopolysaccharide heptosyltransferase II [Gammaproteobacteria bacterium]|nr:lipopolysaccharide heptosyltransferase II [Gammaproteobacteria bacterium]NNF49389.1 lipopolysaccharide heptosyltransferase II [Woeseiaceae bacterium]MBT8093538.1 lipopolysaccharide heptosyltransferase II [Gammaproteobacteria bacterium]MBT8106498.1 lipopolysaccharide heptosyltransferase II [Gammaproteobacteria bacterium]NNK26513.1 lipopolysaccharide heptosyltransferase II [Woeseiaceae bacterium]